jgi:hypothetical protein
VYDVAFGTLAIVYVAVSFPQVDDVAPEIAAGAAGAPGCTVTFNDEGALLLHEPFTSTETV